MRPGLTAADEQWALLPRAWDPTLDVEVQPGRVELALWLRQPAAAAALTLEVLDSASDEGVTFPAGPLLLLGARACADLPAIDGTRATQAARPAEWSRSPLLVDLGDALRSRHASMRDDPLQEEPMRPTSAADALLWAAEWARARREDGPRLWHEPAGLYDELNRPHAAAYCRWRQSQTLLRTGAPSRDVAPILQDAFVLAAQHSPLSEAIRTLAHRARVPLVLDPAQDPPLGEGQLRLALGSASTVARGITRPWLERVFTARTQTGFGTMRRRAGRGPDEPYPSAADPSQPARPGGRC